MEYLTNFITVKLLRKERKSKENKKLVSRKDITMNTKIEELENTIVNASKAYYSGHQIMTDAEFDSLVDELKSIDPDNELVNKVGFGYTPTRGKKVNHLSNVYGISDKRKVTTDYVIPDIHSVLTPKLDGGSIELQYTNGKLIKAVTRGNGNIGIDVTNNIMYSQGILSVLKDNTFSGNVVGEFIISKEDLLNSNYTELNRNIPNGFLGRNSTTMSEQRLFSFIAYKIGISNKKFTNRIEILTYLNNLGFITAPYIINNSHYTYKEVLDVFEKINGKRYMYDGVVSDSNSITLSNSTDDMYEISYLDEKAYKVITESAITKVTGIEWNLTRTGRLVPVAHINQIYLSGAYINRVTLNNYRNVVDSHIGVGSEVEVVRSGEVIPLITKVISESSDIGLSDKSCPNCGSKLVEKGTDLVCISPECNESYSLYRFITVLNSIDGIGSKTINKLIDTLGDKFNCYSIDDFLSINYQELLKCIDYSFNGTQTRNKLHLMMSNIFNHTHACFVFLVALNISGLSWTTSLKLSNDGNMYTALKSNDKSKITFDKVSGVSNKVKSYIINNFESIQSKFSKLHITKNYDSYYDSYDDEPVDKLKVCITGSLDGITKSKFYDKYSKFITESSVKDCDYLVCNNTNKLSSKLKTAMSLNKKVVSQSELVKLLDE